jgi:hypothetical protein
MPGESDDFASRAFNYSRMVVNFSWITSKTGFAKKLSYAFSDSSLQTLAIYMQNQKSYTGEVGDDFVLIEKKNASK